MKNQKMIIGSQDDFFDSGFLIDTSDTPFVDEFQNLLKITKTEADFVLFNLPESVL